MQIQCQLSTHNWVKKINITYDQYRVNYANTGHSSNSHSVLFQQVAVEKTLFTIPSCWKTLFTRDGCLKDSVFNSHYIPSHQQVLDLQAGCWFFLNSWLYLYNILVFPANHHGFGQSLHHYTIKIKPNQRVHMCAAFFSPGPGWLARPGLSSQTRWTPCILYQNDHLGQIYHKWPSEWHDDAHV